MTRDRAGTSRADGRGLVDRWGEPGGEPGAEQPAAGARSAPHLASVIKVGGRAQRDERLADVIAARWRAAVHASRDPASGLRGSVATGAALPVAPARFCIVHGGGDEVTALQRAAGIEPRFVGGRRVTGRDDIDRLRMALSGLANKRLVGILVAAGVRAVGVSGEDGPLLRADLLGGGLLGAVGTVSDVDVELLACLAAGGYLPVIAPVAASASAAGRAAADALNVNGDDAAAAIAGALAATELLLISDVSGVWVGGAPVPALDPGDAERAIAEGEIVAGMEAKVRAALAALAGGVARVRIGGLDLLWDEAAGTAIGVGGSCGVAA